jgi:hypothetical protein
MFDNDKLDAIFDKMDGHCRYCGKKLAWKNYGKRDRRGAWAVEHSVSKANGGTDHLNNLFPSCYACNEEKGSRNGSSYMKSVRSTGSKGEGGSGWGWVLGGALVVGGLLLANEVFTPEPRPKV